MKSVRRESVKMIRKSPLKPNNKITKIKIIYYMKRIPQYSLEINRYSLEINITKYLNS